MLARPSTRQVKPAVAIMGRPPARLNSVSLENCCENTNTWEEYDCVDNGLRIYTNKDGTVTPASTNSSPDIKRHELIQTFNKNLSQFESKLKIGIKAKFWEGENVKNEDVLIRVDADNNIVFERQKSSLLEIFRPEVCSLLITDIDNCFAGADLGVELTAEHTQLEEDLKRRRNMFLTVSTKVYEGKTNRMIALELSTQDERNTVLTGIRSMVSKLHITDICNQTHENLPQSRENLNWGNLSFTHTTQPTSSTIHRKILKPLEMSLDANCTSAIPATSEEHLFAESEEDTKIENVYERLSKKFTMTMLSAKTKRGASKANVIPDESQSVRSWSSSSSMGERSMYSFDEWELESELLKEKVLRGGVTLQMLALNNDLHDRDEQIMDLREREQVLRNSLHQINCQYTDTITQCSVMKAKLDANEVDREDLILKLKAMEEQIETLKALAYREK